MVNRKNETTASQTFFFVFVTFNENILMISNVENSSSLPRLGTSSIKKQPPVTIETSEATLELSVPKKINIATNAGGPPRSARYRPHGYRPPPTRKTSPSSRKSSVDSVNRFTGKKIIDEI